MNGNNRKRKAEVVAPKVKQVKVVKSLIEDIYPFEVPNLDQLSPDIKQYINELEKEYIERYNILLSNRTHYETFIQNMSTQLDDKGITQMELAGLCGTVKYRESKEETAIN